MVIPGNFVKLASMGAKMASKYGPRAKSAWDEGGKDSAKAAGKNAASFNALRKALNHARELPEGSVVKVVDRGADSYVVLDGDRAIAAYPTPTYGVDKLVENADLTKRILPDK